MHWICAIDTCKHVIKMCQWSEEFTLTIHFLLCSRNHMISSLKLFPLFLVVIGSATCKAWGVIPSSTLKIRQSAICSSGRGTMKNNSVRTNMILVAEDYSSMGQDFSPLLVAACAIVLGVSAQSFINQMLKGDQGLGAFLKDGSGYNKSGFRQSPPSTIGSEDPLPWLKLPKLDFVEVAGQETKQEELAYKRLEEIRVDMNEKLQEGKIEEASMIREELELLMKEAGIEYNTD